MAGPLNRNYFTTGRRSTANTVGKRYQVDPAGNVILLPPLTNQQTVPGDNEGREANEMGSQLSYGSGLSPVEMSNYANTIAGNRDAGYGTVREYNPAKDILSKQERDYVTGPNGANARLAQEDIAMNAIGTNQIGFKDELGMLQNREPSFSEPSEGMAYFNRYPDKDGNPTRNGYNSTGGSYGGSLVTGGLSGNLTGLPTVGPIGFAGGIADNIYAANDFEGAVNAQSQNFANSAKGFNPNRYAMFDVNTPTAKSNSVTGKVFQREPINDMFPGENTFEYTPNTVPGPIIEIGPRLESGPILGSRDNISEQQRAEYLARADVQSAAAKGTSNSSQYGNDDAGKGGK